MVQKKVYSNLSEITEVKLLEFQSKGGASAEQYHQLRDIIGSSDKLAQDINRAIANQDILGFRVNIMHDGINGIFDGDTKILSLNPNTLDNSHSRYYSIMTTAHEVQHALDKIGEYTNDIRYKLHMKSTKSGEHDYTEEIKNWILINRELEARAEITGFNAVVDTLRKEKGHIPTLQEIFKSSKVDMENFIIRTKNPYTKQDEYQWQVDKYNINTSYQPNSDMTLSHTKANLEVIASHFFDLSYPNRVAAAAIKEAIKYEKEGNKISLNMQILTQYGITKDQLEYYGIDFNKVIDISTPTYSQEEKVKINTNKSQNTKMSLYQNSEFNDHSIIQKVVLDEKSNLGSQMNDFILKLQAGDVTALSQFVTSNQLQLNELSQQSIQQYDTLNKFEQTMLVQANPVQDQKMDIEPETRSKGRSL